MSINDDGSQHRVQLINAFGDLFRPHFFGFGVENRDRQPSPAAEARHEPGPYRWLHGGEVSGQRLINLRPAVQRKTSISGNGWG